MFFTVRVWRLQGLFIMKLTTKGLKNKLFVAGFLLLKESLFLGFNVLGSRERKFNLKFEPNQFVDRVMAKRFTVSEGEDSKDAK